MLLHTHEVLDAIECQYQVDAIYTDPSKASDAVRHNVLINKAELDLVETC